MSCSLVDLSSAARLASCRFASAASDSTCALASAFILAASSASSRAAFLTRSMSNLISSIRSRNLSRSWAMFCKSLAWCLSFSSSDLDRPIRTRHWMMMAAFLALSSLAYRARPMAPRCIRWHHLVTTRTCKYVRRAERQRWALCIFVAL